MGGHAFEDTRRLTPEQYAATMETAIQAIRQFREDIVVVAPPALVKESHGDLDISIASQSHFGNTGTAEEIVEAVAGAVQDKTDEKSMVVRGSSTMFHVLTRERFQIDLKFVDPQRFSMTVAVASHGRLTHLLNMMLRTQALSIRESGLHIEVISPEQARKTKKEKTNKKRPDDDSVLTNDPAEIARFLGFPEAVFDGTTRFSPNAIVDMVMECKYFDIRRFRKLSSRSDLIDTPIFRTLLDRIHDLDSVAYQGYCRDVNGENKAGRCAALAFGVDFDAIKNRQRNQCHASIVRKKLHNGVLILFVPELRQHPAVLNSMLDNLSRNPEIVGTDGGGWSALLRWIDDTPAHKQKAAIAKIAGAMMVTSKENL